MSEYTPDAWVIIKIQTPTDKMYKVLAGWYGSYSGATSWGLSSGITKVKLIGDVYHIENESGSVYHCHKDVERFTGMTADIFNQLVKKYGNSESHNIEHVKMKDYLKHLSKGKVARK